MEQVMPGWLHAGYLQNVTNPDWKEGEKIIESDVWEADSRGMIVDDINAAMKALKIPADNFSMEGIIDPGDSGGKHSSHQFREEFGSSRDL